MQSHEYRVIPAPRRGVKVKGARTPEDRFARAVEGEMNRMALDGWEFLRSDTLPCEQKASWFSKPVTVFQTMLVFRRAKAEEAAPSVSPAMPPPMAHMPTPSPVPPLADLPASAVVAAPMAPPLAPEPPSLIDDAPPAAATPHLALVEPALQERPPGPRHAAE